jgi:hypothetical protein
MSTELDQAREIAERIARRVASGNRTASSSPQPKSEVRAELADVRAGLSELQRKIAQLEAKVSFDPELQLPQNASPNSTPQKPVLITHSPWLGGINAPYSHPSQEKFGVEEATVTELVDFFEKEKICNVEPGGKPCDHCAMCSSRGF